VTLLETVSSAASADSLRRAGHRLRPSELPGSERLVETSAVLYLAPVLVLAAVLRFW
jgi:hypothetical protein